MYQGNGSIVIINRRVKHPSFYFIVIFFHILSLSLCQLFYIFLGISRVEPKLLQYISGTLTDHSLSGHPKDHSLLASHPVEPHLTDQIYSDLQKSLNLNIPSNFISTLEPPHANIWHHRGGTITHTIDNFGLNPNHRRSVEHTWKKVIGCIEQGGSTQEEM